MQDRADLRDIAEALGVKLRKGGASRLIGLCPVHNERTPSFSIGPDPKLWHCKGCQAGGDVVELVRRVNDLTFPEAVRWLCDHVGHPYPEAPEGLGRRQNRRGSAPKTSTRPKTPAPTWDADFKRAKAHREQAARLWSWCVPVHDDSEALAYLQARNVDPVRAAELDAARVLPRWTPLLGSDPGTEPVSEALRGAWWVEDSRGIRWARVGSTGPRWRLTFPWAQAMLTPWHRSGWRLIAPRYDAAGRLASVQARWCAMDGDKPAAAPLDRHTGKPRKSSSPYQALGGPPGAGSVMASEFGRLMLRFGDRMKPCEVVISEGEIDWLQWLTRRPDVACFGVASGTWTPELAARIPSGSTVYVRTDTDTGGDRYAADIAATLAGRCKLYRTAADEADHG